MKNERRAKVSLIALQISLVCLVAAAAVCAYTVIDEGFESWPTLAFSRPLVVLSIAMGGAALSAFIVVLLKIFFDSLLPRSTDKSTNNKALLTQLKFLRFLAIFSAAYTVIAFFLFWGITQLMHPSIVLAELLLLWVTLAAAALFTYFMREATTGDHKKE